MAELDRAMASAWMYQIADTSYSVAAYDAGGLTRTSASALLAAIMATATDAGVANAASAELMTMVNSLRVTASEAMKIEVGSFDPAGKDLATKQIDTWQQAAARYRSYFL